MISSHYENRYTIFSIRMTFQFYNFYKISEKHQGSNCQYQIEIQLNSNLNLKKLSNNANLKFNHLLIQIS